MTTRKDALALPVRTPAYVSRELGAAELNVSPATWDKWAADGTIPKAAPGFPESTPRWRWADVDRKLAGTISDGEARTETHTIDPGLAGAHNIRYGETAFRRRATA